MNDHRFDMGVYLIHTEKFDEAIDFFEKLVEKDPSDEEAWFKLAVSYVGAGKLEKALSSAAKAEKLNPTNLEILNLLGGINSLMHRDVEALNYFDCAIQTRPNHPRAWISKIVTLRSLGDEKKAAECYRKGKSNAPNLRDPESWNDMAVSLYDNEKYEETIDLLDFLSKMEPEEISYKFNKLRPLTRLERYDEVVTLAEHILENADLAPAWMVKGIGLLGLEKYDEALVCFDRVLKLDPQNSDALDIKEKTLLFMEEEKEKKNAVD
jgi:tetratricopeptide (TPR) repeat protein